MPDLTFTRTGINGATLYALQSRVKRLAKRAAKAGLPEPTLTIDAERLVRDTHPADLPESFRPLRRKYDVTITGPGVPVCRPGYTLLALVQTVQDRDVNSEDARIVTRLHEDETDLKPYRKGAIRCSACEKLRRRNTILVVREDATGSLLTLGTDCAEEFLPMGLAHVEILEALVGYAREPSDLDDEDGSFGQYRRAPDEWPIQTIVSVASTILCRSAFVPSRAEDETSTKELVRFYLERPPVDPKDPARARWFKFWEETRPARADETAALEDVTFEWQNQLMGESDFVLNVHAAYAGDVVTRRTLGIVVATVHCAQTARNEAVAREKEAESDQYPESQHVGEPGERLEFGELEIVFLRDLDTEYGTSTLAKFRRDDGAVFAWFVSRFPNDLKVGDRVTVKATVKRHTEYKGPRQTQVNRANLTAVPATA